MCSKFGQSGLFTLDLPALIAEKTIFDLLGMLNSGEPSLPFVVGDLFQLSEAKSVRIMRHSKTHARVVPKYSAIDCIFHRTTCIVHALVNMKIYVQAKKSKACK